MEKTRLEMDVHLNLRQVKKKKLSGFPSNFVAFGFKVCEKHYYFKT